METHSGNGAAQEPVVKDTRIPLQEVCFIAPTRITGITMMLTTLEAGVNRLVDGKEWCPPAMWVDLAKRLIMIGDLAYPMERVHYFKRAKMAITKKPAPMNLEQFNVGRRKKK